MTQRAGHKNVTVWVDVPDKPLWVRLPEDAIRQILHNVLRNAVDASPPGAQVTVRVDTTLPLRILVSDVGPGIPPHLRDRVFKPFFTTKTSNSEPGMGLGLSVCHGLMEAIGGKIDFQCGEVSGITFKIHLPSDGLTKEES